MEAAVSNLGSSNSQASGDAKKKRKRGRGGKRNKATRNARETQLDNELVRDLRNDDRVIIRDNENFVKYYKTQKFLEPTEFDEFMEYLRRPLPAAFRINTFDLKQANFLKKLVQGPQFNQIVIEQSGSSQEDKTTNTNAPVKLIKISALKSLPWYPNQFAWQMSVSRVDLRKTPVLQKLHRFIMAETENGFISRQEAVSMIPPLVLDVHWGQNILDMCAAPGSKTAQLLEYLKYDKTLGLSSANSSDTCKDKFRSDDLFDDGMVVANDVDNKRCYMLVHQSSRLNSPNCIIINQDASKLPDMRMKSMVDGKKCSSLLKFDRILCDVPCSGDGTARKNVDVWKKWNIQNANNFHRMQSKILKRGLELLKKSGLLVYSTCSLNPVENEAVIASILREAEGKVELVDIKPKLADLKCRPGVSSWSIMGRDLEIIPSASQIPNEFSTQIHANFFPPTEEEVEKFGLNKCIRVLPHLQDTGAFFVACLRKLDSILPWQSPEDNTDILLDVSECNSKDDDKSVRRPPKKRKFKGFKEDPFFFLDSSDPDWQAIKNGFGLGDDFPVNQLVHRCVSGNKRSIYLVSKRTRNFILTNCEEPGRSDFVKIINGGMRLFSRASSEAGFRICQDGVNEVLPYITERLKVQITKDDLIALLKARTVPFEAFSCVERLKDNIKLGSFILIYKHEPEVEGDKSFEIPLVAWKGEYTVSLYVTNTYKVHLAAIVDIKLDEFSI